MKTGRNLAIIALVVAALMAASLAKADPTDNLNMTFQSGATFSGVVTFASGYNSVEAVIGTLTGYQDGIEGYAGSGADSISWVWYNGSNYASTSGEVFGTFLMDGPANSGFGSGGFNNWVDFTYDYTNAPTLVLDSNSSDVLSGSNFLNGVDGGETYSDPMVSGSLTPTEDTPTPEPSSLWLLGSGLAGLAGMVRRKIGRRA